MVEKYQITKKDEVYKILKSKRNFGHMSEKLLKALIDHMKVVRFTEKKILIKENTESNLLYIIITGCASIYLNKKLIYTLKRTGDVFGEVGFITKETASATVVAEKNLGVMAISYNFLKKNNSNEFWIWLCRILGEKLIRTSNLKSENLQPASKASNTVQPNSKTSIDTDIEPPESSVSNINSEQEKESEPTTEMAEKKAPEVVSEQEITTETEEDLKMQEASNIKSEQDVAVEETGPGNPSENAP